MAAILLAFTERNLIVEPEGKVMPDVPCGIGVGGGIVQRI